MSESNQTRSKQTAYAKINLALHVLGKRADGYHDIETLFAFLDQGDEVTFAPQQGGFDLSISGEFADGLSSGADNLITKAAKACNGGAAPDLAVALDKHLPVAAGLGGGSADAAAVIRELGSHLTEAEQLKIAASLGADVPACVASIPVIGRGPGAELAPVKNDVTGLWCLLVNPRQPLSTADVFAAWSDEAGGGSPLPQGSASEIFAAGRNDLEAAAAVLCPAISDVLGALWDTRPIAARMSGSGATCFALYQAPEQSQNAAEVIGAAQPGWWQMRGQLR